jgi:hypothetical protein
MILRAKIRPEDFLCEKTLQMPCRQIKFSISTNKTRSISQIAATWPVPVAKKGYRYVQTLCSNHQRFRRENAAKHVQLKDIGLKML